MFLFLKSFQQTHTRDILHTLLQFFNLNPIILLRTSVKFPTSKKRFKKGFSILKMLYFYQWPTELKKSITVKRSMHAI